MEGGTRYANVVVVVFVSMRMTVLMLLFVVMLLLPLQSVATKMYCCKICFGLTCDHLGMHLLNQINMIIMKNSSYESLMI